MNIKLDNYYVTRGLNIVLAKDKVRNDQTRMINPDYFKNINLFGVYKEGNYYSDKSRSHKDIIEELTSTSIKNDFLYILDLFQLADYIMDMLYTTANDRNENIRINNNHGSKISIYHPIVDETYKYPIVSVNGATHTSNKISRLHKALKGF